MAALDPQNASWLTDTDAAVAPSTNAPTPPKTPQKTPPAAPPDASLPKDLTPTPAPAGGGLDAALKAAGDIERQRAQMMPPKLELPDKPKTAKDDITAWGAIAIAFAGLASLRTRTPMTTALNASATAIQAMQQGQKEQADQAFKEWKQQTDIALELHSSQQRAYEELMNSMTHREELGIEGGKAKDAETRQAEEMKMRSMAAALQDPGMLQAYKEGGLAGAAGLQKQREVQAQKLKENSANVARWKEKSDATQAMEESDEFKQAKASGDWRKQMDMLAEIESKFAGKGQQPQRMLSDAQVQDFAKAVVAGKMQPPTNAQMFGARSRPDAAAEWAEIKKLDPEYDPNLWDLKKQALKQLQGPDGEQIKSFTVLLHHTDFLGELATKLLNTDQRHWNEVTNSLAKEFGMPEITNFEAARSIVSKEAAKAITGTQTTGGERSELENFFDPNASPEQIKQTIDTIKGLVQGQLAGKLSKYRMLVDKGWLNEDDIVPQDTLDRLGATSIKDRSKVLAPGGKSLFDRWGLTDVDAREAADKVSTGGSPKISQAEAMKAAPKGATAMRQKEDGSWEYKDAQGKIIGQ